MVPDFSQRPHNTTLNTDEPNCWAEELLLPSLDMDILEFSHPFEQHSANDECDVDTHDADEELHALGLVNSVEYAHFWWEDFECLCYDLRCSTFYIYWLRFPINIQFDRKMIFIDYYLSIILLRGLVHNFIINQKLMLLNLKEQRSYKIKI